MVWMFFVEQVCHKDILEFMQTLRKRRCPQPKEIEDILSVGFFDSVGRALRPISDFKYVQVMKEMSEISKMSLAELGRVK